MIRITRFALPLVFATALTLGACSGEADIDINADSTAAANDTTVVVETPAIDTAATVDVNVDTTGNVTNEGVEKLVEAQLMVAPGYADVKVEVEGDGAITLTGTVATDDEKTNAEAEAKKVVGVKSVTNNITVKK